MSNDVPLPGRKASRRSAGGMTIEKRLSTVHKLASYQGVPTGYFATWSNDDLSTALNSWERLAKEASEDPLTGTVSRRAILRYLSQVSADSRRRAYSKTDSGETTGIAPRLIILLVDLDNFKAVNDMYGHQAGDDRLRAVAQAFRQSLQRPGDIIGRIGGDEFLAILPDTTIDATPALVARLRSTVYDLTDYEQGISVGVAALTVADLWTYLSDEERAQTAHTVHADETVDPAASRLLARADAALYADKNSKTERAEAVALQQQSIPITGHTISRGAATTP